MREHGALEQSFAKISKFETELSDSLELVELAEMEGDEDILGEALNSLIPCKKIQRKPR